MPQAANVALFVIKINGSTVPNELMDHLLSVDVDTSLYLPATATLEVHDRELSYVDNTRFFSIGHEIEISAKANTEAGKPPAEGVIFEGLIAAIEPVFSGDGVYARLVVRAYDRLHLMHRGAKSKTFQQQKDSDIVSAIAGESGLQASVTDTTVVHQHVYRDDQSDFDFLQKLARRNGFVLVADGRQLKFAPVDQLGHPEVPLRLGEGLREFRPALTLVGQVDEVTVGGWDRVKKQAVTGQSIAAKFKPNATGFARGFAILQTAHSSSKLHLTAVAPDQAVADVEASAVFDRLAASDLVAEGVAFGDPRIKPGGTVDISQLGKRFSGKYFVTRVRHQYDSQSAYTTTFWTGGMNSGTVASLVTDSPRALAAPSRPIPGLYTAVVTNTEDPAGVGRVRVKFPQISDTDESSWAPVASAGAGNDRGLWIIPEVNDEVLVGFLHGDINYPVVLGGLWNGKDKPPDAVPGDTVDVRTWKTRVGHVIRLTDKEGSEKIEVIDKTKNNSITIDSAQNTISILAARDINIEAKGNVAIKGVEVKIEGTAKIAAGAPVVQAEGKTQIALKGGMAELSATGITKVSGSMVNIN